MATNPGKQPGSLPTDDDMVNTDDITQVDQEPNTATRNRANPDMRSVNLPTDDEVAHIDDITQVDEEPGQANRTRTGPGKTSLWLLIRQPNESSPNDVFVMVVEAPDEQQARQQAAASPEGRQTRQVWIDPSRSSCRRVDLIGQNRVVVTAYGV